ncbi:MAG: carboxypeptidase regulatory-like domain-containing protein [Bryobacteraceae bacterium]
MRVLSLLVLALSLAQAQNAGEVRGTVVDGRGGEALSNVVVQLAGGAYRTTSDSAGRFRVAGVTAGDYVLNVFTVGYHLVKRPFHLDAGETKDFEVVLNSDTLRQTTTVDVQAGPFDTARQDSPDALVLAGNDAKNLGSVLADDPLRAVQNLPGVSSNNDFDARFSLRGADYSRIGLFLDGILLHSPFHMLQGQAVQGSATAFNGDMVDEMELHEGAWPERYEDRTAGVLDVHTRDGNRDGFSLRASASASNAGVMAEGPLGKKKRGSWIFGVRKSYLQYIFERTFPDTSFIFGFEDAQGRLSYDLTPRNTVTLYVLESYSTLDRSNRSTLGVNSLAGAAYHYTLANLGWRYSTGEKLLVSTHAAWMREKYENTNPTNYPLGNGFYGEWVANSTATWYWNSRAPLDFGVSLRQIRESGDSIQYNNVVTNLQLLDHSNGDATHTGGFAQQSWTGLDGHLHLSAGARWDRLSIGDVAPISPQASAAFVLGPSTRLQLGWGQYVQYQELSLLTSPLGGRGLLPSRSNHVIAAAEQRLGARTRMRLEYYNRADRDLAFQPLDYPRLLGPSLKVFAPPLNPPYVNSQRGYSRGVEAFLQRNSANRYTGWISYAYGRTEMTDGVTLSHFPSDYDQRHTVNIYGGYRIKPTVNLSLRSSYGSGFPIPGYLTKAGSLYYLTTVRNQLRMPAYSRTDLRVNKSWTKDKWKLTLYGEVVNLTNRTNYIFDSFDGYNATTHQAYLTLDTMFPILPSAGIVFEK